MKILPNIMKCSQLFQEMTWNWQHFSSQVRLKFNFGFHTYDGECLRLMCWDNCPKGWVKLLRIQWLTLCPFLRSTQRTLPSRGTQATGGLAAGAPPRAVKSISALAIAVLVRPNLSQTHPISITGGWWKPITRWIKTRTSAIWNSKLVSDVGRSRVLLGILLGRHSGGVGFCRAFSLGRNSGEIGFGPGFSVESQRKNWFSGVFWWNKVDRLR
jgi:hypothetical protein